MNYTLVILSFLLSGAVASTCGLAVAFMCVYLPVQMLFSSPSGIPIAYWPHITAPHGAMYGAIVGSVLSIKKFPRIRLCILDAVMVAVLLSMATGAAIGHDLHAFANVADNQLVEWLLPYFLARLAFADESARAAGARVLCGCVIVLSFFGVIETRLWPYFVSRNLKALGLFRGDNALVYHRFGFMRAMLTFAHPIDLGNVALMLVGIIPILAITGGLGTKKWYVRLGWVGALFLILIAISFTDYFGLIALAGMYFAIKRIRALRRHLALTAMVGIGAMAIYTSIVLSKKTPPRPPAGDIFAGSLWIRQVIVHRGWAMAKDAGWFGFGQKLNTEELHLDSVDNAYILLVLNFGWLTLGLFLLIPVILGARLSRALRRAWGEMEAQPLLLAAATVAGIMVAMYTVWFGFVYANIFAVLLGFSATLAEYFLIPRTTMIDESYMESDDHPLLHPATN